jgi:hypothetical protein
MCVVWHVRGARGLLGRCVAVGPDMCVCVNGSWGSGRSPRIRRRSGSAFERGPTIMSRGRGLGLDGPTPEKEIAVVEDRRLAGCYPELRLVEVHNRSPAR